jgi:hypothetical protein
MNFNKLYCLVINLPFIFCLLVQSFIVHAMNKIIDQHSFFLLALTLFGFAISCGGGGGNSDPKLAIEVSNGDDVKIVSNGDQSTIVIRTKVEGDNSRSKVRSKTGTNVYAVNGSGQRIELQHSENGEYAGNAPTNFTSNPILVDASTDSRSLRKIILEPQLEENGINLGTTNRQSTSVSYILESSVSADNWLEAIQTNSELKERLKTRQKTLVGSNTVFNNLIVDMKGTGNMQAFSHLGNIMFDDKNLITVDHNSNTDKRQTFSLVRSGPADLIIQPGPDSEFYSLKVTKGVIDYESGASYNTKYGYYENSTFIDHLELGFFTEDIKISVEFRWKNNAAPVISSTPGESIVLDKAYTYTVAATDANGDVLTYQLVKGPHGMSMDNSGTVTWMANVWGDSEVIVSSSDGYLTTEQKYTLKGVNNAPQFNSAPVTSAQVNVAYNYTALATDIDEDTLVYELVNPPTGMTIGANTGVVNWTPATVGNYNIEISAKDNRDNNFTSSRQSFVIVVTP